MKFEATSRWSLAVRCPRMGAYSLRGATPEPPDEYQLGYFRRGKQLENDVYESLALEFGADDLIRHKPIPWPGGIAHGDIFICSLGRSIEVKSLADPRPLDYHLMQLAGQILFDEDATDGALCVVNPSNLQRRWYPMPVVTDELAERVHATAQAVALSADPSSPLPPRVCGRPSDAQSHMCPFSGDCFAGWVAPDPVELEPDVALLVSQHAELDDELKQAKETVKDIEERRSVVREELGKTIEPAREYLNRDDELVVRRTPVAGRVTWDVDLAIRMGAVNAAVLEPFRRVGAGFDRWTVKAAHLADAEPQDAGRTLAGLVPSGEWGDEAPF